MALSQELLEILVCPACRAPVKLTAVCPECKVSVKPAADNQGLKCGQCGRTFPNKDGLPDTAVGQGLKCGQCHRVYPIEDDIPVMIVDQARIGAE